MEISDEAETFIDDKVILRTELLNDYSNSLRGSRYKLPVHSVKANRCAIALTMLMTQQAYTVC